MTPDEIKKIIDQWGRDTVIAIQTILVDEKKVATKQLRDSIKFTMGEDFVKFTMAEYGKYIDITSENPAPRTKPHWVPIAPLKQWARVKGFPEKAAYQARWAIHLRGSKRIPFFQSTIEKEIPNLVPQLGDAIIKYFGDRIELLNKP